MRHVPLTHRLRRFSVIIEAILAEEQTESGGQLPVYLEMVDREVSSRLLTDDEDDVRTGGALMREIEGESLPLHLVLTPPQMLGQVEVLTTEEMAEFQKEFAIYDETTQMAVFEPIHNVLTQTWCTIKDTIWTCGIGIPGYCNVLCDRINGE
jgi:hypothetical protein